MRQIKVLLFALENINNVGEELLRKCTERMIKNVSSTCNITIAQLMPTWKQLIGIDSILCLFGAIINKISLLFPTNICYKLRNIGYVIKYSHYLTKLIKQNDKIILAVGMLKYSTQNFSYIYTLIAKISAKYNKLVMMSAMSIQPGNKKDWRYQQLVKAVNMPSIHTITTRDGQRGIDILKSDYITRNKNINYVGDPALWIPETYSIHKTRRTLSLPHIGINVIRNGIFDDYNKSFSDDKLFDIYIKLINKIEQKGWKWSLFHNGMKEDYYVLKQLQNVIGCTEEHIIHKFSDSKNYVKTISEFDVVFGARLHACITSVAVGTPVVGFIWDDKLKYFAKTMGIADYFFIPCEMNENTIFSALENAMNFHFDFENRDRLKQKFLLSIQQFLD